TIIRILDTSGEYGTRNSVSVQRRNNVVDSIDTSPEIRDEVKITRTWGGGKNRVIRFAGGDVVGESKDKASVGLDSNSHENQKQLQAGLAPLVKRLVAER